jgi:hypothetical protein
VRAPETLDLLPYGRPLPALARIQHLARLRPLSHFSAGSPTGLRNIWAMGSASTMALLSLLVVGAFAAAHSWVAVRVFARAALR